MDKGGVGRGASEQNINSCLKRSKRVQMGPKWVPNGQKHLGWPFWSLLSTLERWLACHIWAIFGPKWTTFGPPPVMNGGPQSKKRLITTSPMCGLLLNLKRSRLFRVVWAVRWSGWLVTWSSWSWLLGWSLSVWLSVWMICLHKIHIWLIWSQPSDYQGNFNSQPCLTYRRFLVCWK